MYQAHIFTVLLLVGLSAQTAFKPLDVSEPDVSQKCQDSIKAHQDDLSKEMKKLGDKWNPKIAADKDDKVKLNKDFCDALKDYDNDFISIVKDGCSTEERALFYKAMVKVVVDGAKKEYNLDVKC